MCYGIHEVVDEKWVCSWCKHVEETWDDKRGNECLRPRILCPKEGGALKPVGGDLNNEGKKKFAHLFCSLWTPHVYVEDTKTMEPAVNIVDVREMKTKMVCNVCKVKHGVCVRCSSGSDAICYSNDSDDRCLANFLCIELRTTDHQPSTYLKSSTWVNKNDEEEGEDGKEQGLSKCIEKELKKLLQCHSHCK
ncbi:uncharacterized protein A4U43_C08F20880 [Asparagus officinalis]|nr:uncharacterized protein A4U43_C08F20880 [Asparagus officinalis]